MPLTDWLKLLPSNSKIRVEAAKRIQAQIDNSAAASHTHSQSDVVGLVSALAGKSDTGHSHSNATTSAAGFISATDKTKLDGIANGATANDTDANLKNRANHTGTQAASTISDFDTAVETVVDGLGLGGSGLTQAQVLARGLRC